MTDEFSDIAVPATPSTVVTSDQIIHGPPIPPQQRILLYSAEEWEELTLEWAHFCLEKRYRQVQRFSGAGDKGIDIAGFVGRKKLLGVWDNYQCKRYLGRAITPIDAWPEIGKILWHSFNNEYRPPRRYFFVAPHGVGTKLAGYLGNVDKLKAALIENWDKHVRKNISDQYEVPLEGLFRVYVEAFDFSIFDSVNGLQLIEEHRKCPYHAARFGGGLGERPPADEPPQEIAPKESHYVGQLLEAYADHTKKTVPDVPALRSWPKLRDHFRRQREAFYHAESLRVFARDSVPAGTFESLQDDIHTGVIDICDANHSDGYECVCKVTEAARQLHLTSNALLTCAKPKDRDGICHQLSNEDRLQWLKK